MIKSSPEKILRVSAEVLNVLLDKLSEEPDFTGQVEFTVHCRDGGIGNVEAFTRRKIVSEKNLKNILPFSGK